LRQSQDAGLYSVSARAAGVVSFVLVAATYPLSPLLARLNAAGEHDQLRRIVRISAVAIFAASIPIATCILVFAKPLLGLFGTEFAGGQTALAILVAGQLVFTATGLAGVVLVMTGREGLLVTGAAVAAVSNVTLNAVLIPTFGLNGAAVGTTISSIAGNVCFVYYARRRAGVPSSAVWL